MPMEKPRVRLIWRGKETIREILRRLHEGHRVRVALPAGFHHTVCVQLAGDPRVDGPLDRVIDDAAFERLVRIHGLCELADLREPLARANIGVRVRTPPPQIILFPRATRPLDASCVDEEAADCVVSRNSAIPVHALSKQHQGLILL